MYGMRVGSAGGQYNSATTTRQADGFGNVQTDATQKLLDGALDKKWKKKWAGKAKNRAKIDAIMNDPSLTWDQKVSQFNALMKKAKKKRGWKIFGIVAASVAAVAAVVFTGGAAAGGIIAKFAAGAVKIGSAVKGAAVSLWSKGGAMVKNLWSGAKSLVGGGSAAAGSGGAGTAAGAGGSNTSWLSKGWNLVKGVFSGNKSSQTESIPQPTYQPVNQPTSQVAFGNGGYAQQLMAPIPASGPAYNPAMGAYGVPQGYAAPTAQGGFAGAAQGGPAAPANAAAVSGMFTGGAFGNALNTSLSAASEPQPGGSSSAPASRPAQQGRNSSLT